MVAVTTGVEVVGGDAVVVKRASGGGPAVEGLRREGERLRGATHPGVVSVLRSAPVGDGWELVMAHGGRSLSTLRHPTAAQLAGIVAGVSSTLADLHEIGITHGRLDSSHVLVGDNGRPRLCGLGDGSGPTSPEDDVASLGRLLIELLGNDEAAEPIPDRRWRPRRRWHGWERRALLLLADQATADAPSRRPSARRFAAAVSEAVPAPVPSQPLPSDERREELDPIERLRPASRASGATPRRPLRALALAVAGGVLAVLAIIRLQAGDPAVTTGDVDADTGADIRVAAPVAGSVLVADGRRFRVGQEGDHLLVGDWRCDGSPTPAAFRPSTHEVFVFDRWTAEEPISVEAIATVVDSVELISDGDRCPTLAVRTSHGAIVPVRLEPPR
jgi:hypothetical protein